MESDGETGVWFSDETHVRVRTEEGVVSRGGPPRIQNQQPIARRSEISRPALAGC
jgi:hypothetical protein